MWYNLFMTKVFYNKRKYKKRLKLRKKNFCYFIVLIIASILFIYSLINIIIWLIDSPKTKEVVDDLEKVKVVEVNNDDAEIIPSDEPKSGLYWDFIKMSLIDVDINELKKKNNDTVAWIQVGGTNVNYPIVQTTDNDFYLDHSFTKEKNTAGWLFMDYRNNLSIMDQNTIVYGHNRKDQTMFGTLKNVTTRKWFDVSDNQIIKMSSENNNTLWQIFSVYIIPTTNDYLNLTIDQALLDTIAGRSIYKFNAHVTTDDKIITLSTCNGADKKLVVHAKLIKIN